MSVLGTLVSKSGGSVAKLSRGALLIGCVVSYFALTGCSIGRSAPKLPAMDLPFESDKASAFTAVDRRTWRVNDKSRFSGLVVADEPQAAEAARDILERGGNAADAATALYFALSVTYPGAAGLGGGGSCLYSEPGLGGVEQIDFPVQSAQVGGAIGIPGNLRGFAYLSIRHGRMAWDDVMEPATHLAGLGAVMSRATQSQMLAAKGRVALPESMSREGKILSVGRDYRQGDTAAALGLLQGGGAGAFYNGDLGDIFRADAARNGTLITEDELRSYQVRVHMAERSTKGGKTLFTRKGAQADAAVWGSVDSAAGRSIAPGSPSDSAQSSFVVADEDGSAVACVVSLGRVFGTAQRSATSGIYFADTTASPDLGGLVIAKHKERGLVYVGSSRGTDAGQKSATIVAETLLANSPWLSGSLRNHQGTGFNSANVIYCKDGIAEDARSCRFGTDPDGYGYGLMAR